MTVFPYTPFALLAVFCLMTGYALGARRSRAVKRRVLRDLNAQSLELLDAKSSLHSLQHYASQQERKDRLLKLTLRKLQAAEAQCRQKSAAMSQQSKKYFVDTSLLRLDAVESRETAIKAAKIAHRATARLQRLDRASPVTQTNVAPAPESFSAVEAVSDNAIDQNRLDTSSASIMPVSSRDSARFTKLHNNNETNTTPA